MLATRSTISFQRVATEKASPRAREAFPVVPPAGHRSNFRGLLFMTGILGIYRRLAMMLFNWTFPIRGKMGRKGQKDPEHAEERSNEDLFDIMV